MNGRVAARRLQHQSAFALAIATTALAFARPVSAAPPTSLDRCLAASSDGQARRDEGRYLDARALLRVCANDACPAIVRQNCEKWLRDVEAATPTVVLALRRADGTSVVDASISVDGALVAPRLTGTPIPMDPGERRIVLHTANGDVEHKTLILAGEKNRAIVLTAPPAKGPDPTKPTPPAEGPTEGHGGGPPAATIALGAVGAVALGAFTYVGLTAKGDLANLERAPCAASKTCDPADTDSVRARFLVADIALAAGVVALGAAAYLWIADGRARVQVTGGPAQVALTLSAPIP